MLLADAPYKDFWVTHDDPMMNRQERDSIISSVTARVLELLHKTEPITSPSKNGLPAVLKTWVLPLVPTVVLIIGGAILFNFSARVNDIIANNKTVVALDAKINGAPGEASLSDRLAILEGSVHELSEDLHIIFEKQLSDISKLPPTQFKGEIDKIPPMFRLASTEGFSVEPGLANTLRLKMATVNLTSVVDWRVAAILITAASSNVLTRPATIVAPGWLSRTWCFQVVFTIWILV